jgi:hypothetical protein
VYYSAKTPRSSGSYCETLCARVLCTATTVMVYKVCNMAYAVSTIVRANYCCTVMMIVYLDTYVHLSTYVQSDHRIPGFVRPEKSTGNTLDTSFATCLLIGTMLVHDDAYADTFSTGTNDDLLLSAIGLQQCIVTQRRCIPWTVSLGANNSVV